MAVDDWTVVDDGVDDGWTVVDDTPEPSYITKWQTRTEYPSWAKPVAAIAGPVATGAVKGITAIPELVIDPLARLAGYEGDSASDIISKALYPEELKQQVKKEVSPLVRVLGEYLGTGEEFISGGLGTGALLGRVGGLLSQADKGSKLARAGGVIERLGEYSKADVIADISAALASETVSQKGGSETAQSLAALGGGLAPGAIKGMATVIPKHISPSGRKRFYKGTQGLPGELLAEVLNRPELKGMTVEEIQKLNLPKTSPAALREYEKLGDVYQPTIMGDIRRGEAEQIARLRKALFPKATQYFEEDLLGEEIRDLLSNVAETAREPINRLYDIIEKMGSQRIPLSNDNRRIFKEASKIIKKHTDLDISIGREVGELEKITTKLSKPAKVRETGLLDPSGMPITKGERTSVTMQEVKNLLSGISSAKPKVTDKERLVLTKAKNILEGDANTPGIAPPILVQTNKMFSDWADTYKLSGKAKNIIGQILDMGVSESGMKKYTIDNEKVVKLISKASKEDLRQLDRALGEKVVNGLLRQVNDTSISQKIKTAVEAKDPEKIEGTLSYIQKNKELFNRLYGDTRKLESFLRSVAKQTELKKASSYYSGRGALREREAIADPVQIRSYLSSFTPIGGMVISERGADQQFVDEIGNLMFKALSAPQVGKQVGVEPSVRLIDPLAKALSERVIKQTTKPYLYNE